MEKAEKIANTYTGATARLKTTLPKLSSAMAYVSGSASQLGLSLGESVVGIGLLQTKGIEGARAGNSYNAFLRTLLQLLSGQRSFDPMLKGLEMVDKKTGKLKSVVDIVAAIEKKLGVAAGQALGDTANSAMKTAALVASFGEEGSRAIIQLMGQAENFREATQEVESFSALEATVAARQAALNSQWMIAKNRLTALAISVGDSVLPAMKGMLKIGGNIIGWLTKFAQAHPSIAKFGALMLGAFGVMMLVGGAAVVLKSVFGILAIKATLSGIAATYAAGGFTALAVSVWATLWPILAITAAVAGLIYLLTKIPGVEIEVDDFVPDVMKGVNLPIGRVPAEFTATENGVMDVGTGHFQPQREEDSSPPVVQKVDQSYHKQTINYNVSGVSDTDGVMKAVEKKEKAKEVKGTRSTK